MFPGEIPAELLNPLLRRIRAVKGLCYRPDSRSPSRVQERLNSSACVIKREKVRLGRDRPLKRKFFNNNYLNAGGA
jgi:hypothetical protein